MGYSLLGNKPVSFCYLPTGTPHIVTRHEVFAIYRRGDRSYRRGVLAWKKIQNRSPQKSNHLLIFHEDHKLPSCAIIINQKALSEVFEKNYDLFGRHYVSVDSLIEDLKDKNRFEKKLLNHHLLMGILLGYGRGNAEIFIQREMLIASMMSDELRKLEQRLRPASAADPFLYRVSAVRFVADFSLLETRLLIEHYDLIQSKLTGIFNQSDWLPVLLNRICKQGEFVHL